MRSAMYVGCLCVCLSVCVCVSSKKFVRALSSLVLDIAIIFSEQLGIVTLRRRLVFGGNPSKNIDAIRYRDVL